jgi:hypothetical protein
VYVLEVFAVRGERKEGIVGLYFVAVGNRRGDGKTSTGIYFQMAV